MPPLFMRPVSLAINPTIAITGHPAVHRLPCHRETLAVGQALQLGQDELDEAIEQAAPSHRNDDDESAGEA